MAAKIRFYRVGERKGILPKNFATNIQLAVLPKLRSALCADDDDDDDDYCISHLEGAVPWDIPVWLLKFLNIS